MTSTPAEKQHAVFILSPQQPKDSIERTLSVPNNTPPFTLSNALLKPATVVTDCTESVDWLFSKNSRWRQPPYWINYGCILYRFRKKWHSSKIVNCAYRTCIWRPRWE